MSFEARPQPVHRIRLVLALCVSLLLCACTTLSSLEKASLTEIDKLHAQFQKNPDNPLYHIKVGEEYEKLAKAGTSTTTYVKKAITSYQKALQLDPDNTSLKFSLYQLLYPAVIAGEAKFPELTSLYLSVDSGIRKNMNPPHLALFQHKIEFGQRQRVTNEELEQILYKAFEESPFNPLVSYLLSIQLIDQEHHVLGIDLLKRSLTHQPDLPILNAQLGEAYDAYANKDGCPYEHPAEIRKSLDYLQKATQKDPGRAHVHLSLATQYQRLNVPFLTLESARKLVALESSHQNRAALAEAFSNVGQLEKAEAIYAELLNEGVDDAYLERAMVNAEHGNWQLSYEAIRRYLERHPRHELPIYSAFLYLAVEAILGKSPTSLDALSSHIDIAALNVWEKALLDFWYDLHSEDKARALADTLCKQVELNFLAGVRQLNQQNLAAANLHFQSVLRSNTYSFVEYRMTRHLNRTPGN